MTNTLSLEIQGQVVEEDETMMYPPSGQGARTKAKYLRVRAVKKGAQSEQKLCKKYIKLQLIDHNTDEGIPYKNKLQVNQEDEDDENRERMNRSEVQSATNRAASSDRAFEAESARNLRSDRADIKEQKRVKNQSRGKSNCCTCNWIRSIVSTNKIRLQEGGYNLDLTYITNRIIACGFPAAGFESMYRNRKSDIV